MAMLRKRGLATVVIHSGPFLKLGQNQARILGVPDLPLIEIEHPLGGCSIDEVRARAAQAAPGIIELIRGTLR
jgi:DNA-binding protein Fis